MTCSALKSFRDAATESLKRERSTCAAAKEHAWSNSDDENVGLLEASKQQQMMQVASDLEFNDAMIAEREQGIQEVEKAVREVNEIFKDLSIIVSQQGEQVWYFHARLLFRAPTRCTTDRRHRRQGVECGRQVRCVPQQTRCTPALLMCTCQGALGHARAARS
jgi:hypothetical protein